MLQSLDKGMEGKVCIITGASSGIGKALSYELAKQGAIIVLVARRFNLIHDFANDTRFGKFGESGEVNGCFCVARATEDATRNSLKGEDMAGLHKGIGMGFWVGEQVNCACSVGC